MPSDLPPFLTARQAAELLGVRIETVYAYVSRGLIQSEADGEGRRRRYRRQDVERLRQKNEMRRRPEQALESALHFGGPVLDSAITLIADGELFYRGRNALELAGDWPFEQVAGWVWGEGEDGAAELFRRPPELSEEVRALDRQLASLGSLERFESLLPSLAARDPRSLDRRPWAVARTGARLLQQLAQLAAGTSWRGGVVATLAAGWDCPGQLAADLLSASLVLCIDHELNVSAFTVRCVASAGSTPYPAVAAGLAALQGPKHGGHTLRMEALLREIAEPRRAAEVLAARLSRGESVPGFGQPLYAAGDPRCRHLLEQLDRAFPGHPQLALAEAVADAGRELLGEAPTLDFGLVFVARVLDLPAGAALTLFALGRVVGWIGHAMEQYARDQLIRPRARYVGPMPADQTESSERTARTPAKESR